MGPALPAGTVIFLFTDVEGSTRLVQQRAGLRWLAEHGDAAACLPAAKALVCDCWAARGHLAGVTQALRQLRHAAFEADDLAAAEALCAEELAVVRDLEASNGQPRPVTWRRRVDRPGPCAGA
jgi:hypothetical protein